MSTYFDHTKALKGLLEQNKVIMNVLKTILIHLNENKFVNQVETVWKDIALDEVYETRCDCMYVLGGA